MKSLHASHPKHQVDVRHRRSPHRIVASSSYRASGYAHYPPEPSIGSARLLSRRISLNPMLIVADFCDDLFCRLDLVLASASDKRGLTWAAALGNGVAAATVRMP